jgi:uncharacterized BrkB/YihY/UPF0761 family membrane protein
MSGFSLIVGAFGLALIAMSFAFAGGAVIVVIPVVLVALAVAGFVDMKRRRKQAQRIQDHREQAKTDPVEFTERDQRTLVSE